MSDAEKVAAEVIEDAISPLSKAEQWLAMARETVAEKAAMYQVPDEITTEREYKDAKASRAGARRDAAELDAQRKAMTREMDDALKRFRSEVRGVLEPLTDIDVAYKAALDAYDERWGAERRQAMADAYDEYAPDLVPLVPLDRLIDRYGSERGKAWLNRSTNVEAAKASLRAAVDAIAAGERTVAGAVDHEDAESAKADFFSTLDVGQAISNAQARAAQREQVRRLEEERRRREEEYARIERERQAVQPAPEPEPEPPRPAEPAPIIETGCVVTADEYERLRHATGSVMPRQPSIAAQTAMNMAAPIGAEVPDYVFCGYGNLMQAQAFAAFCKQHGIERYVKVPTHGVSYKLSPR